jgi:hypothetical protein
MGCVHLDSTQEPLVCCKIFLILYLQKVQLSSEKVGLIFISHLFIHIENYRIIRLCFDHEFSFKIIEKK